MIGRTIKRYFYNALIVSVAAVCVFGGSADAVDAAKVGGVNLQFILDNSKAGEKALAELQVKAEKERAILLKKQEAIKALEKELSQRSLMMRESALAEKDSKLRSLRRELSLYQEDTKQILQRDQNLIMRRLLKDILRIINDYAAKNGYTLIVERGAGNNLLGSFVLYMDKAADLTATVVKLYDKEFLSGKEKAKKKK